jgi:deoxycytidylate deaminase
MCAKLLVQAKVKRVLFLPREPEYYLSPIPLEDNADEKTREEVQSTNDKRKESNETKMKQVDSLFTASSIAQTRFVLQVEKAVLTDAETKSSKKNTDEITVEITVETKKLIAEYEFDSEWMDCIEKELPWPAFDNEIQAEVMSYFENAMKWMARAKVLQGRGLKYEFERYSETSKGSRSFNPVDNSIHAEQACHFLTIARFLAERTDDPKTGVGAVIVQFPEMEIISLGWNGFPLKALYGEFPRASKSDESKDDKKYPYVVHAEQNALLFRNRKKIDDEAILFVTKSPCNECTPLIAMHPGIKTVVVDDDVSSRDDKAKNIGLGYKKFPDMVEKGRFFCFQTKALEEPKTDDQKKASRKLRFHKTSHKKRTN